jgi:predicted nucleotidyltransferase
MNELNKILEKHNLKWLKNNTIFLTITGSTAYGLSTPESDVDYKGIVIPPKQYFLSDNHFDQADKFENVDCTIFNILKFFKLTLAGNPNMIEVLWTNPEFHVIRSEIFDKILEHRDKFLSKNVRWRFSGYAYSQISRIKTHYRWLKKDVQLAKPSRADFGLASKSAISKENIEAANSIIKKKIDGWNPDLAELSDAKRIEIENKITEVLTEICGTSIYLENNKLWKEAALTSGLDLNFIELVKKEKEYEQKLRDWQHYQEWKQNRNPKRAEIEAKYGYDAKHACHVVRLMKMCEEVLSTGQVIVKRPDREELLAIRNGAWTYEYLLEWAENMDKKMNELYKTSILPNEPDRNFLNNLCMEIIEEYLF